MIDAMRVRSYSLIAAEKSDYKGGWVGRGDDYALEDGLIECPKVGNDEYSE